MIYSKAVTQSRARESERADEVIPWRERGHTPRRGALTSIASRAAATIIGASDPSNVGIAVAP